VEVRHETQGGSGTQRRGRVHACRKLADGIGISIFAGDLGKSLDVLTVAAQNPHLPPHRRAEINEKRRTLKESIELTLELHKERNEPLNELLVRINQMGEKERQETAGNALLEDSARNRSKAAKAALFDCSDGYMCAGGR